MNSEEAARRLLEVTEPWFPFSVDPAALTAPQLALAGFARCRRLLRGMLAVHDSPDLAGVFARTLYETWVSSLYLLLGGDQALERLMANDEHQQRRVAKRLLTVVEGSAGAIPEKLAQQARRVLAEDPPRVGLLDLVALAMGAGQLLEAENDPNAKFPVDAYAVIYGPESYTSAHGGIGAMKQQLLVDGEIGDEIFGGPWRHRGHDRRLALTTAMVLTLANRLGRELALDVEPLGKLAELWNQMLSNAAADAVEELVAPTDPPAE